MASTPTVAESVEAAPAKTVEERVAELEAKLEHFLNLNLTAEEVDYLKRLVRRG